MKAQGRRVLEEFRKVHPGTDKALRRWYLLTAKATWGTFADLRATFATADLVPVRSGRTLVVFDIGGNKWRLAAIVNYAMQTVHAVRVMTHAEYSRGAWKDDL